MLLSFFVCLLFTQHIELELRVWLRQHNFASILGKHGGNCPAFHALLESVEFEQTDGR